MRVWLITVGEPLPTDGRGDRLLRTAILAEMMAAEGHEVLFWTSAFDHVRKRHRSTANERLQVGDSYQIQTLCSIGYRHNISVRRIVDQVGVARQFRKLIQAEQRPDVILCSLPTLELCDEATKYGERHGVPVILDIRDLWPDLFLDLLPGPAKAMGKAVLTPMFRQVQRVCRKATALCGITDEFVDWGLAHGNRQRSPWDRTFAMAYRESAPPEEELAAARQFWKQQGLTQDQFIACFFGVIGRHSDIETVIAAARRVEATLPDFRAVLCGVGPNFERCKIAAEGSSAVILPGWINAAQIWTLLRMSRVGLAPFVNCENYTRNLPNKPIEYLSAGLPIVTSLRGVLSNLLGKHECGVVYGEHDSVGLATSLTRLHQNPSEVRRMSSNAQRLYNEKYRASVVYAEMSRYLSEVAKQAAVRQAA